MKRPTLQITTTRLIVSAALTLFACAMTASAQTGTSAARPRATEQAPQ